MLVIEGFVRILVIVFLEVICFDHFYANSRSCYPNHNKTICYFQPNETFVNMTWDDAWNVCKENNSTLPVIENLLIAETLRGYLETKNSLPPEMWLAGRENRTEIWQWLSGKRFGLQSILKGSHFDKITYRYDTNAVIKDLRVQPDYPNRTNYYICYYTDSKLCQNKSIITWENGCLFVNNDEELNLVDARNRCLDEGGDLATFEEDESLNMLKQKNSSLLHTHRQYWIGLRLNWWIWNETVSSREIKYSNWTTYENFLNKECLYIRLIDYKWNQFHCTAKKPFICQTVNMVAQTQGTDAVDKFSSTWSPEHQTGFSKDISVAIIGSIIAVVIVAVIIVILVVILKIRRNRKTRQQQNDATRVQTDGSYQDLRRGRDNIRSDDPYMELQGIAHQQTELSPDYQNLSDYDDVVVAHVPNYLNIVQ